MKRKQIIMMKFNREEGLTLIELLITIAVIAIVAAISVPVITNVIGSSSDNAAASMSEQLAQFIAEGEDAGLVEFDGTDTFTVKIDSDGDGSFADETALKTLVVDGRFSVLANGAAPTGADNSVVTTDAYTVVDNSAN